jgi:4-aminobutyrate aminotransferase-like enzyme
MRDEVIDRAFKTGVHLHKCEERGIQFIPALNTPVNLIDEGLSLFVSGVPEAEQMSVWEPG